MANSVDPDQTSPDLGLHCLLETSVIEILGHLLYRVLAPDKKQ